MIARTGHDAYGGALDAARGAGATPGPGEHHPEDGVCVAKSGSTSKSPPRGPNLARMTGRSAAGGPLDAARDGADTPGPGEHYPDLEGTTSGRGAAGSRGRGVKIPAAGRDAPGGPLDAARRGRDAPGPGEYHPDDGVAKISSSTTSKMPPRGVHFGRPPPAPRRGADAGPAPGEYHPDEPVAAPPRGILKKRSTATPGVTIPRAEGGSSLVAKDAGDRPGPGEYDAEFHPKTIAGLVREALKKPGAMGEPPPTRRKRFADGPGPGEYHAEEDPSRRGGVGITIKTRKAWEPKPKPKRGAGRGRK